MRASVAPKVVKSQKNLIFPVPCSSFLNVSPKLNQQEASPKRSLIYLRNGPLLEASLASLIACLQLAFHNLFVIETQATIFSKASKKREVKIFKNIYEQLGKRIKMMNYS